jgi:hypothetical protein
MGLPCVWARCRRTAAGGRGMMSLKSHSAHITHLFNLGAHPARGQCVHQWGR